MQDDIGPRKQRQGHGIRVVEPSSRSAYRYLQPALRRPIREHVGAARRKIRWRPQADCGGRAGRRRDTADPRCPDQQLGRAGGGKQSATHRIQLLLSDRPSDRSLRLAAIQKVVGGPERSHAGRVVGSEAPERRIRLQERNQAWGGADGGLCTSSPSLAAANAASGSGFGRFDVPEATSAAGADAREQGCGRTPPSRVPRAYTACRATDSRHAVAVRRVRPLQVASWPPDPSFGGRGSTGRDR